MSSSGTAGRTLPNWSTARRRRRDRHPGTGGGRPDPRRRGVKERAI